MKQELTQVFKNEKFGNIRVISVDGREYFVATDVAKALGYVNPRDAIAKHCRWVVKCDVPHPQSKNKTLEVNVIPEGDLYRLITNSQLPSAKEFESWIYDEVLPSLRKTGSYSTSQAQPKVDTKEKEIEARLINARVREASMLLKIADKVDNPTYQQIMYSKATEVLNGKPLIPLPKVERKTYSAAEIGEKLGVTAHKVGSIANKHNLKTEEYGLMVWDKSQYSNKQVETWRYYGNVVPVLKSLMDKEQKGA